MPSRARKLAKKEPKKRPASGGGADTPIVDAMGAMLGAALVLDHELRIQLATPAAIALLGFVPPLGVPAPRVLCGSRSDRPVAEALAAGEPVEALIPNPGGAPGTFVRVRACPVGPSGAIVDPKRGDARPRSGWLLLLDPAAATEGEGVVDFEGFVTADPGMKHILRIVERVAREDATVLVRGETGTGKDLIARALHLRSPRRAGPFRALNCAALPPSLLESELFGHARGAFTGAIRDVPGHIQLAHGGTLFLDEVAELPLELQAKLLRTLETRTVIPVGAREPIAVDVRIVSATHRALRAEVAAGRFRADLMYRLRVVPLHLPPLRDRPEDIRVLVGRFVAELSARGRRRVERVSEEAMHALVSFDYPGNVRELRNLLEYAFAVGDGPVLLLGDLPSDLGDAGEDATMRVAGHDIARARGAVAATRDSREAEEDEGEAERIRSALARASGNRSRAAAILGVSRVTLWRKMQRLARTHAGIVPP